MRQCLGWALALLLTGCATTTSPSSGGLTIDTLDFVIGDPGTWPRSGSQWQHQVVDHTKREVCWVKYGNARMFECWRWDDEWIYHRVDHGIDGNTGESYEFTAGEWLPRRLSSIWSLDVPDNRIRWFDAGCRVDESKSRPFPYRQRAWLEGARDLGPDLGVREVLVLEYAPEPDSPANYRERFYFARGAGWYSWENPGAAVRFDRFGGPARSRATSCGE
jgi:hypothetical protein